MFGSTSRRWNWLEWGLIPLVASVMRVAWMTPLVLLMLNNPIVYPSRGVYPAWWLLALMLGAVALERWLHPKRWGIAVAVGVGLLAVPVTWGLVFGFPSAAPFVWLWGQLRALVDFQRGIPSGLIVMLVTLFAWQRGLNAEWTKYRAVWGSFVWGTLALGGVMLFRQRTLALIPGMWLTAYVITFLLAGLLSLALLALVDTLAVEQRRGSGAVHISRQWFLVVVASVMAISLLGWLIGMALAPEMLFQVVRFFAPLWQAVTYVLIGIMAVIAFLTMWFLEPIMQSIYERTMPRIREIDLQELRKYLFENVGEHSPAALGIDWQAILKPLFVLALMALAVWLFIRAWRRLVRSAEPGVIEERESILSAELLRSQVGGLFSRRRRRVLRRFLPLDPTSSRDAIRAYYQAMLAWAEKRGMLRPKSATPQRYQQLLAEHWPENAEAIAILTRAYIRARYGPEEPSPEDVALAKRAWEAWQKR